MNMPLRRSPPRKTHRESTDSASGIKRCEPELAHTDHDNVTIGRGSKIKRDSSPNIYTFMKEIRDLLAKSSERNDNRYTSLQSTMKEILAQNKEIKESIDLISKQYDEMKIKCDSLEKLRKEDRLYIDELEEKVNIMEQSIVSSKIELKNIPVSGSEGKEKLCDIVLKTANVLDFSLQYHEIKDIYRTKNKTGNGSIIVDFCSTLKKESFLKSVRKFNTKNGANKLNTSHLVMEGPKKPVYIAEHLTQKGRRLNYLARTFAQQNGYKFCWTSFGKTYLRQDEGKPHTRIDSESDIAKLQQQ